MGKLLNDISQYVNDMVRLTSGNSVKNIREDENFQKHLLAVAALHEKVSKLYQPDENGAYPKVSNAELDSVRETYMDIYHSGNQLRLAIADMDSQDVPPYIPVFRRIQTFLENMLADFHQINNSLDANNKSLRVVKDDEWQQLHLTDLTYGIEFDEKSNARQFNYFTMVADLPNSAYYQKRDGVHDVNRKKFYEEKFPQLKKPAAPKPIEGVRLDEMNAAGMRSNSERITELGKQLLEANSGFFIGSAEFKALMSGFQAVAGKALKATEPMRIQDMTALQQSYRNLMEKTNIYLAKKEREEIALKERGKEPSANMEKRMTFARVLREFVDERLLKLDHQVDVADQQKLAIAKKLTEGLKANALKDAQTPEEQLRVQQTYSGKSRQMLEESVLNNEIFRKVTGSKTAAQLKELAGGSLESIQAVLNQDGAKTMDAPEQPTLKNPEKSIQQKDMV